MANFDTAHADQIELYLSSKLKQFSDEVQETLKEANKDLAKQAVKKLKSESPDTQKGKYKKGWRYRSLQVNSDGSFSVLIYNATHGSITHLIENGHPIISHGVNVGYLKARRHIGPVREWIASEGAQQIAAALKTATENFKM